VRSASARWSSATSVTPPRVNGLRSGPLGYGPIEQMPQPGHEPVTVHQPMRAPSRLDGFHVTRGHVRKWLLLQQDGRTVYGRHNHPSDDANVIGGLSWRFVVADAVPAIESLQPLAPTADTLVFLVRCLPTYGPIR